MAVGGSLSSSILAAWGGYGSPFSPFLKCDAVLPPDGSGTLADPARIDEEFRQAWFPYISRSVREHACLFDFEGEVEGGEGCLSMRRFISLL